MVTDKYHPNGQRERIVHNVKAHFTGCIDLLEPLRDFLHNEVKMSNVKISQPRKDKSAQVRMLEYSGRKNLKKLYDFMYKDCDDLYLKRKKEKFEEIFCALSEKSLGELGLTAGTPEMVISNQAVNTEGSSTIPEMGVESSDSKCPTLTE